MDQPALHEGGVDTTGEPRDRDRGFAWIANYVPLI